MIQELINFSKIVILIGRRSERKMKNIKRAALFVLILSMLLPGCGADNNNESPSDDAENEKLKLYRKRMIRLKIKKRMIRLKMKKRMLLKNIIATREKVQCIQGETQRLL